MSRALRTAVALLAGAFAAAPAFARAGSPGGLPTPQARPETVATPDRMSVDAAPGTAILDVPFVPQSEALCGGAAAAMVLRYWGARDVVAEQFAPLLDADRAGIRVDRLAAAVRDRGWQAVAMAGTPDIVRDQLARRRPVIALVAVGRNRYHYLVVVAWSNRGILAHDPARAPDRAYRADDFEAAWARARHWMLVITPSAHPEPASVAAVPPASPGGPGVASNNDNLDDLATDRIRHGNPAEAVSIARQAVRVDPAHQDGWYLLGAAQYLNRDTASALEAWNHIGEPRLDLIRVEGLGRSSYASVAGIAGLAHGDVITAEAFARARRRIADLPAVRTARVDLEPRGRGEAQIDVGVVERSNDPTSLVDIVVAGARAAIDRDVAAHFTSPDGGGDEWSASWRWWQNRPRVGFTVAAPGLLGTHAVWRVEGAWEAQTYGSFGAVRREERAHAALSASDWITAHWQWRATSGLDRWASRGAFGFAGGALRRRSSDDRLDVVVGADAWLGSTRFARVDAGMDWISKTDTRGWRYLAAGGVTAATARSPLDLWQGAGTGHGRMPLLRAHPLLEDGVVIGPAFGRTLQYATIGVERWPSTLKLWGIGVAGFLDAASVQERLGRAGLDQTPTTSGGGAWFADAGAGLRLRAAWLPGVLRLDVAHGLRDGANAVSLGWQTR